MAGSDYVRGTCEDTGRRKEARDLRMYMETMISGAHWARSAQGSQGRVAVLARATGW